MSSPLLIAGLGNPGPEYAATRHNAGWMAVDELATRVSPPPRFSKKFSGAFAQAAIGARTCHLLRPETFMNDSGRSVRAAQEFFRVDPRDVVILHDELDVPFGDVRVKLGGGHAGHNGLRSVMAHLGTGDFVRVRIGIGRPPAAANVVDYVLSTFSPAERAALPEMVRDAADAVVQLVTDGLERTMNRVNGKIKAAAS
jgi:PTH1 family peptidyl-tRNA hydrolase